MNDKVRGQLEGLSKQLTAFLKQLEELRDEEEGKSWNLEDHNLGSGPRAVEIEEATENLDDIIAKLNDVAADLDVIAKRP